MFQDGATAAAPARKGTVMPSARIPARGRTPRWSLVVLLSITAAVPGFAEPLRIHSERPQLPPRTVTLEEIWRVGGEDSDFIFGMVIDSLGDAEGNVYLLDNQLCQVEVFDATGEHLRTLSRQGDGPGEVRTPIAMTFMDDGTLGLVELFPAKVVKLTATGEPAGTLTFTAGQGAQTGFTVSVLCRNRGGVLVLAGMKGTPADAGQNRNLYVAGYGPDGRERARFIETNTVLTFNPPTFVERELLPAFWFGCTVGPEGRVYLAPARDSYEIRIHAPDGTLERVITRDFEIRRRDARDRRRMQAMVDAWYTGVPVEVECTFEDHDPVVSELHVAADGALWVRHSRSGHDLPDGILANYDVFDADGSWRQEVAVECEGDPAYDGLRFLDDGRVLLIKGYVLARWASLSPGARADFGEEEPGPMEVMCCRMVDR
jgi:hypothetical protein